MMGTNQSCRALTTLLCFTLALLMSISSNALAQGGPPLFSKAFSPDTVGPGSASRLVFTIENTDPSPASDLAFVDNLPAGMTIADAPDVDNSCGGTVSAPAGGTTISLSGGSVGGSSTCTLAVNIFADTTPGVFSNTSGDLTSDAGNSGTASADLTVVDTRPGFAKAFDTSPVNINDTVTLTFLIDNSANGGQESGLFFTDTLPAGTVIANPANASLSGCVVGNLTANSGESTISLSQGLVAAGEVCTIVVDVFAETPGLKQNVTSDLTSTGGNSGFAADALQVNFEPLTKVFTDNPTVPGGSATLEFTIVNTDRDFALTNLTFTDDLDATLSGLTATDTPLVDPCGAGSSLTGTSVLTLTGGTLAPGDSCTFSVQLAVPGDATPGSFVNTTSTLTGDLGGNPFEAPATDNVLIVDEVPLLEKAFLTNPVAAGGETVMEFTITNTDPDSALSNISFEDPLLGFISGVTVQPGNQFDVCGGGSQFFLGGLDTLTLVNGSLAAGASCTFSVTLGIPEANPTGTFTNTTSAVTGSIEGQAVEGPAASEDLEVLGAPSLTKEFTDDPVMPGDTVTLEFTLTTDPAAPGDTTDISFTDDLDAVISGLVALGLPQNDVCGAGSQISGTDLLTLTGGLLAPDDSCTFSVTVQVPANAPSGSFLNETSEVTGTLQGLEVTGPPGVDTLQIPGIEFTKVFLNSPVIPGGQTTLEFTISNTTDDTSFTDLSFSDDLDNVISGMTATNLPQNDVCGAGSLLQGTPDNSNLLLTGGSLAPGVACTFSVTIDVPANAPAGEFSNTTSNLSGDDGTGPGNVAAPATADILIINALSLQKFFSDDPVMPGDTVTLEFILSNQSDDEAIADISFSDDLDAVVSGLQATGLPQADVCGAGSQVDGTSTITLTGASLAAGAACSFAVTLQVPGDASAGNFTNTTSAVSGMLQDESAASGDPASDDLQIRNITFSKTFEGPGAAGGTVDLTFTISNGDPDNAITNLSFADDLDAVLPGLQATGLPASGICGAGSQISGSSVLNFSGGTLAGGASCQFSVTLSVPESASGGGSFFNTTSDLLQGGLSITEPATDVLDVNPAPDFSKAFSPLAITLSGTSTLIFTIDNTGATEPAEDLAFTDNLPAGLQVANPANASTTCNGGTVTASSGSAVISYSGGSVPAGASCTVQADVVANSAGVFNNVSEALTSSIGSGGSAVATLTVVDGDIALGKSFASEPVLPGGQVVLNFTIANGSGDTALTDISFSDDLDAVLSGLVATGLPASDVCGDGSVLSGDSVITLSDGVLAAGGVCAFSVTVAVPPVAPTGFFQNTTSSITGNLGQAAATGPAASDTLLVEFLNFSKTFLDPEVEDGDTTRLRFTINNPDPVNAAEDIEFTDSLDPVLTGLLAEGLPINDVCGPGSVLSGADIISLTGADLAGGQSCSFEVTLRVPRRAPSGTFTNITDPITALVGGVRVGGDPAVTASDSFSVDNTPFSGPANVPTLTFYWMLLMAALLGVSGLYFRRRMEIR